MLVCGWRHWIAKHHWIHPFAVLERIMLFMEVQMGVEILFRQNIIERGLTLKNVGKAMRCKLDWGVVKRFIDDPLIFCQGCHQSMLWLTEMNLCQPHKAISTPKYQGFDIITICLIYNFCELHTEHRNKAGEVRFQKGVLGARKQASKLWNNDNCGINSILFV